MSAVLEEEHDGYVQRLEAFATGTASAWPNSYAPSAPAAPPPPTAATPWSGQPETLVVCERMETARLLLYGLWEGELEHTDLDDLAYACGARRPTR
ncbi:hypothetical protein [Streptomyces sp. 2112.3]|uniref:hypothetical protein n=1 Tax=Streptomyces sp. 2112.3 TaxID=1881023 RepID=UPI00115FF6F0|nr:hypothetical protein [Streptomyces sp. 2112.3]